MLDIIGKETSRTIPVISHGAYYDCEMFVETLCYKPEGRGFETR
jgi:hypothetical protein